MGLSSDGFSASPRKNRLVIVNVVIGQSRRCTALYCSIAPPIREWLCATCRPRGLFSYKHERLWQFSLSYHFSYERMLHGELLLPRDALSYRIVQSAVLRLHVGLRRPSVRLFVCR